MTGQANERRSTPDAAPAPAPSITLHIEELALHDFPRGAAHAEIGAAVERELARLLTEDGLPPGLDQDLALGRLTAERIEIAPDAQPDTIGAQIAEAVYRGLRR